MLPCAERQCKVWSNSENQIKEVSNFCSNNGGAYQMLNLIKADFAADIHLLRIAESLSPGRSRGNILIQLEIGCRSSIDAFDWPFTKTSFRHDLQDLLSSFTVVVNNFISNIIPYSLSGTKTFKAVLKSFFPCQENIALSEWWTKICKKNHSNQIQPLSMGQSQNMI